MATGTLSDSVPTFLDASGNGVVGIGPISAREVWHPANVHVQASSNTLEAQCAIYVGDAPIQRNFRAATSTGSTGDSSDTVSSDIVKVGSKIWAVWSGGDPGAQATLAVTGTKDV